MNGEVYTEIKIERDKDKKLSEIGFQYNVKHDIWIMPVVKNIEHFQHWVSAYPFYQNIQNEGVTLYDLCI